MQLSSTSGQGTATLAVTVARNDLPAARSGAVAVNDQRFTISQEPRPCTYELRASTSSLSSEGGRGSITVETLSGCPWTAASSAAWLRVLTPSGNGAGSLAFEAAVNSGQAREASIAVAGQSVTISQSGAAPPLEPNCTVTLAPVTIDAAAAGGTHTVTLGIPASCDWTASSSAPWLTFAPLSGRGNATITLTVARNTGSARSATLGVGNRFTTVNQAAAPVCTVAIDPASASFTAVGGVGVVRVTTQDGCEWTATGGASWTQITNGRGTGSGEARYLVIANTTTAARSTTLSIGGQSHSVSQQAAAPVCTYSIDPPSRTFAAAGGDGSVTVNTQAGCAWTASGAPSWITVTGGQGTGPGQFSYTVQAHDAASSRSGTISVGGQAHTVTQEAAAPTCTYSLQPASRTFTAAGGEGRVTVTTQPGCTWTASSGAPWAVVSTPTGTGQGDVVYNVEANSTTSARSTSITVNGQSHMVTQDAAAPACTYIVQPTSQSFPSGGGSGQFDVVTQAGCSWSASSGATWATVTTAAGTGPGAVAYTVQPNPATTARQTLIQVNGATHSVTQDAAPPPPSCSYAIDPSSREFGASGGEGIVLVTTGPSCAWSASSPVSWITMGTSSGTGSGEARYTVAPNDSDDDREATLTIAGHAHRVDQEEGDDDLLLLDR